jgi:hypothetical protein
MIQRAFAFGTVVLALYLGRYLSRAPLIRSSRHRRDASGFSSWSSHPRAKRRRRSGRDCGMRATSKDAMW